MVGTASPALPAPATPLVARDEHVVQVRQRLLHGDGRLLTLTGPAGTGKTRLALAVAAGLTHAYPDGVWFVDLAPIDGPDGVLPTIARTLGVREAAHRPLAESVKEHLRDQVLLLVLDNFEHVLPAALQVADLLAACARLHVLATSREPLRVRWEYEYPVPPLAVPDPRQLPAVQRLALYGAIQLFVARVRAIEPEFALTEDNAAAIAGICCHLDGLPLALELAAARIRLFPPATLLAQLDRATPAPSLDLLTDGARDLPARHRTLRTALAWSYDLLTTAEQALFMQLGVFAGGCMLEAAEAVCLGPDDTGVALVDGLGSLMSKNLLRRETAAGVGSRFRMLETMREFAREQLNACGDMEAARQRHADHFLALARQADRGLTGTEQAAWLERLEQDHDDLRAALRWTVESGDERRALQLAGTLWQFWWLRGYLTEGRGWLNRILALPGAAARSPARTRALLAAGLLAVWQGDYAAARPPLAEALAEARAAGDEVGVGHALMWLGRAARDQGDEATAHDAAGEGVACFRRTDDTWGLATALHFLGLAIERHDNPAARACFTESAALFRAMGDRRSLAMPTRGLGIAAYNDGALAEAHDRFEESTALFSEFQDDWSRAMLRHDLGYVALREADPARAATLFAEALTLWRKLGNTRGCALCLTGLAGVAASGGQMERAATLFGAAETIRIATGGVLEPTDRAVYDANVTAVRAALGEGAFAAAWAAGRGLSREQAITVALAIPAGGTETPGTVETVASDTGLAGLTPREREVVALLARGLSNRRIGEALVITEGTAGLHVKHILGKLGLSSRAQIAAWAVQHGVLVTGEDEARLGPLHRA